MNSTYVDVILNLETHVSIMRRQGELDRKIVMYPCSHHVVVGEVIQEYHMEGFHLTPIAQGSPPPFNPYLLFKPGS